MFLLRKKMLFTLMMLISAAFAQAQAQTQTNTSSQFLALADFHFNPFSYCSPQKVPCETVSALRAGNPTGPATDKNSWLAIFAQMPPQAPSSLGSDTNETLLDLTLNYLETLPVNYDFITVNGDFIAHHFSSQFAQYSGLDPNSPEYATQYQAFVRQTFEYLQYRLQQVFPSSSIYISLGNNDSYDGDYVYSPDRLGPDNFYHEMMHIWDASIMDNANQRSFDATFEKAGYYAITVPENDPSSANRILFLNTNLYSAKDTQGAGTRVPLAAQQQLDWLKSQLEDIRKHKGHAILVYHISNGADNYASASAGAPVMLWGIKNGHDYNQAFTQLIQDYKDVISSTMTAHFHMDGFQFLRETPKDRGILDTFVNGISPNNYSNPGFKLYQYDPANLMLNNFQTWYFNDTGAQGNTFWSKEYDFNEHYQPTCASHGECDLSKGYRLIKADIDNENTRLYVTLYSAGAGPIDKASWLPYYWCATQHQLDKAYAACLKIETAPTLGHKSN